MGKSIKCGVGTAAGIIAGLLFFYWIQGTRDDGPQERAVGHQTPPRSWTLVHQEDSNATSLYPSLPSDFTPISKQVFKGVEKFVFFVGYPRSGHSIVGSMMDAHPDIIIAHEFMLFKKWSSANYRRKLMNKGYLFNALYQDSYQDAKKGWRSSHRDKKGYTLDMPSSWQGRFRQLRVIGDKSGGQTAIVYSKSSKRACQIYKELVDTVKVPIHIIHVVRNPYDIIATDMLYRNAGKAMRGRKLNATVEHPYHNNEHLRKSIRIVYSFASAVRGMIKNCHLDNTLEIHHADHVKHPKETLQKICDFLDVKCPEGYLQECDDKTYKQLSKTRELVVWNQKAHRLVKAIIKKFPVFHRYTFDRDY